MSENTEVGGLVERLRDMGGGEHAVATCKEAATTIETLSSSLASERAAHAETKRERDEALRSYAALVKRFTPKPIGYAPKDRLIIGVERPPLEKTTFFYDVIWSEEKQDFMTASWPPAYNGATHFLDPEKMIGIVWPREKAAARRVREGGEANG